MISAKKQLDRLVKLGISAMYYVALRARGVLGKTVGKLATPKCIVLYYHSIRGEERQAFARQMDKLSRLTIPISLDSVGAMSPQKHYSLVTFDDGFENVIENGIPELIKRGIAAIFFVTAGSLGECASWWPGREREYKLASEEQLRRLPGLITIGSHTLSHPKLTQLGEEAARSELGRSKAKLEAILNRDVTTFSFPYGDFNSTLIQWCREAGYERIFTTLPTPAFVTSGEYVSGRVTVEPTDWSAEFYLKAMGAYSWLPYAISIKKRVLRRTVAMPALNEKGNTAKSNAHLPKPILPCRHSDK